MAQKAVKMIKVRSKLVISRLLFRLRLADPGKGLQWPLVEFLCLLEGSACDPAVHLYLVGPGLEVRAVLLVGG